MEKTSHKLMSFKNLQLYLQTDRGRQRVNAALSPSAHSTTLLQGETQEILQIIERAKEVLQNKNLPTVLLAVIELQLYYGLRISEVLNINAADISSMGHIKIKGAKGSNDRIVIPFIFTSFWQNEAKPILPLVNTYSRFWFYRQYKNIGFYALFGTSKVYSVTHLFRHLNILSLKENFHETELTQKFIGHKSINSTKHYENKKKL